ncbi:MAG: N-acetylmuramoyl-L-alanine amidase [Candidatus Omnitrophica bacterium]|nr:N-acetylmuramoyl-L-alanine amidase [Candidatus Omnitrophota bacterium]
MTVLWVSGCATVPRHTPAIGFPAAFPPGRVEGAVTHTVERGQTLYRIAKIYKVEVSDLMRVNHIYHPSQLEKGLRLIIPLPGVPGAGAVPLYGVYSLNQVRSVVGPRNFLSDWRTVTLHHSATLGGSARLFDRDHRRRHMGGLFYHFVIGNGTRTRDGDIEVGWRWKKQVKANRPYDIQICLVGDFNRQKVSDAQFDSMVKLIRVLQEEYGVPLKNIRRHEDIKGRPTECPGKNFPFHRVLSKLSENRFER